MIQNGSFPQIGMNIRKSLKRSPPSIGHSEIERFRTILSNFGVQSPISLTNCRGLSGWVANNLHPEMTPQKLEQEHDFSTTLGLSLVVEFPLIWISKYRETMSQNRGEHKTNCLKIPRYWYVSGPIGAIPSPDLLIHRSQKKGSTTWRCSVPKSSEANQPKSPKG